MTTLYSDKGRLKNRLETQDLCHCTASHTTQCNNLLSRKHHTLHSLIKHQRLNRVVFNGLSREIAVFDCDCYVS